MKHCMVFTVIKRHNHYPLSLCLFFSSLFLIFDIYLFPRFSFSNKKIDIKPLTNRFVNILLRLKKFSDEHRLGMQVEFHASFQLNPEFKLLKTPTANVKKDSWQRAKRQMLNRSVRSN